MSVRIYWAEFDTQYSGSGTIQIDCTVGNTSAVGIAAVIQAAFDLTCSIGSTVASGVASGFVDSLSSSVGNTAATGISCTFSSSVSTTTGNAVTNGTSASIELGSNVNINCTIGDTAAAGTTCTITLPIVIVCTVASTVADGIQFSPEWTLVSQVGNATSNGITSTLLLETEITCSVANSVANGVSCTVGVSGPMTLTEADLAAIEALIIANLDNLLTLQQFLALKDS